MSQPRLKIDSVTKSYENGDVVLKNFSLSIMKKEFLVLVGPSGCGKSTLLRIVAGLDRAESGAIYMDGEDVSDMSPGDRNIAMVFQDYALYPSMTVEENLSFGLRMRHVEKTEIRRQVDRAAQVLGIEPLLGRKPKQLSGGQRQRVAIGRAIVRNVNLFLFDEPLSNLDAQLRSHMRIELASLHSMIGATSVYVTHDQIEAMTLADRIVVMNRGKIQQIGTPTELYNHPGNRFVASFIGSPTMNFLEGEIVHEGSRKWFQSGNLLVDLRDCSIPRSQVCTLGVRPEAVKILTKEGRESVGVVDFDVSVKLKEAHGYETHMVVDAHGQQLIIRSANPFRQEIMRTANPGEKLAVTLDRKQLHFFGKDGNRLDVG
jgi:ABC-type sugar transport system ATPase subunit